MFCLLNIFLQYILELIYKRFCKKLFVKFFFDYFLVLEFILLFCIIIPFSLPSSLFQIVCDKIKMWAWETKEFYQICLFTQLYVVMIHSWSADKVNFLEGPFVLIPWYKGREKLFFFFVFQH